MKIRLAHHYWRDKTNATWNPERFPFPAIEDEIKKNYAILEAERPKWKQYGNITVFFDYSLTKDVYGRDIVPISFAFVPDCQNPAQCYPAVAKRLRHAPVSQTEMELPDDSFGISKKNRLSSIFAVLVALLSIIIIGILFIGDREEPEIVIPVSETEENIGPGTKMESVDMEKSASPAGSEMSAPHVKNPEKMANAGNMKHSSARNAVASGHEKSGPELSPLCDQPDLRRLMTDCARTYFDEYCANRIEKGQNFGKWYKVTNALLCSRNSIISDGKYIIFREPKIDDKIKSKVETIFKTGR